MWLVDGLQPAARRSWAFSLLAGRRRVTVSAMKILVTAGPTREYIDAVRFISNASSGRMGCAVADAAASGGHDVTLLHGPLACHKPKGCRCVPFVTVDELRGALNEHFADCDALVMAAAVGDFRTEKTFPGKLRRGSGPITLKLFPTEDILAGLKDRKRTGQVVLAFAVEEGDEGAAEAKARAELAAKGADYVVVNTPAAMGADSSRACILSPGGVVLPWDRRTKKQLAEEIIKLLSAGGAG